MLLWMILEPNIFINVKFDTTTSAFNSGDTFLNLDIYNLYDNGHTQSGSIPQVHKIGGSFIWSETGPGAIFTQSKFEEFENAFAEILDYRDIKYFLGFHNHEASDKYNNMIDYIKDKIFLYFKLQGVLGLNADITDMRST